MDETASQTCWYTKMSSLEAFPLEWKLILSRTRTILTFEWSEEEF